MPLRFAFLLAIFISCFSQAFAPYLPIMAFSPFLALACLRLRLIQTLWLALASGLCLDLLSSGNRLGIAIVSYILTILIVHRQRNHFFEDKVITFSLYGTLISSLTTLWMTLITLCTEPSFHSSWEFFAIDLILLPCVDGVCGFCLFILPHTLYLYLRKTLRVRFGKLRLGKSS